MLAAVGAGSKHYFTFLTEAIFLGLGIILTDQTHTPPTQAVPLACPFSLFFFHDSLIVVVIVFHKRWSREDRIQNKKQKKLWVQGLV